MEKQYKGFSLFNDQEEPLRSRNRAVVIANIAEDNMTKEKRITPKGAALMMGYFTEVPAEERKALAEQFVVQMTERGFAIAE